MKEKLIKYSYYLMIIIMIVIATYVLINWLMRLSKVKSMQISWKN